MLTLSTAGDVCGFTKFSPALKMEIRAAGALEPWLVLRTQYPTVKTGAFMVATGELIRLMNYVDDLATTLRRISAAIPFMTDEERKRLAEYMRKSDPSFASVLEHVDRGGK